MIPIKLVVQTIPHTTWGDILGFVRIKYNQGDTRNRTVFIVVGHDVDTILLNHQNVVT